MKFSPFLPSFLSCLAGLCIAGAASAQGASSLAGDSIDASMRFTVDTGYGLGRIKGHGLDGPFVVADGASDARQYAGVFTLDVDGDGFAVSFIFQAGWQEGVVLRLEDLDFGAPGSTNLSDVVVDSNLAGYTLSFGPRDITIGLGGTQFTTDTYLRGRFVAAAVPEPSSWLLLGAGLGAAVLATRGRPGGARRTG